MKKKAPGTSHQAPVKTRRTTLHLAIWPFAIWPFVTLTACSTQHRLITVTSDPPGAQTYLNGVDVGRTPLDVQFTWFGVYDVRLELDGYETLETSAEAEPNLHDQPGFDLLHLAIPGDDRTEIAWHFTLTPEVRDPDALIERARELKSEYEDEGSNRDREGADEPEQPER